MPYTQREREIVLYSRYPRRLLFADLSLRAEKYQRNSLFDDLCQKSLYSALLVRNGKQKIKQINGRYLSVIWDKSDLSSMCSARMPCRSRLIPSRRPAPPPHSPPCSGRSPPLGSSLNRYGMGNNESKRLCCRCNASKIIRGEGCVGGIDRVRKEVSYKNAHTSNKSKDLQIQIFLQLWQTLREGIWRSEWRNGL